MLFSKFLQEQKMNSRTYAAVQTRFADSINVGFEFEMSFPFQDAETMDADDIKDFDELGKYFFLSRMDHRMLERRYDDWIDDKAEEWADDNYENFIEDDDDGVDELAKERAIRNFKRDNDLTELEYIKEEYGSVLELVRHFDFAPTHGWQDMKRGEFFVDKTNGEQKTLQFMQKEMMKYGVWNSVEESYNKAYDSHGNHTWYLTSDGSIEAPDGHVAVEVVTCVMPLGKALEALDTMFNFMIDYECKTNASTGLHINISMRGIKDNLDKLKFILFLGERHISAAFDRLTNTYAIMHLPGIINAIKHNKVIPKTDKEFLNTAWQEISMSKYSSVNFSKLKFGYLEIRSAGGANYHRKFNLVKETVLRISTALEIACNPSLEKDLYAKKIYKLFNVLTDESPDEPFEGPKEFARFYKLDAKRFNTLWADFLNSTDEHSRAYDLLVMILACKGMLDRINSTFDPKEIVKFRNIAKKANINRQLVDEIYHEKDDLTAKQYLLSLLKL